MRRGTAVFLVVCAVAAPVAAWRYLFRSQGGATAAAATALSVERLPRPAGVVGAARAVCAAGDVLAACFDDGSLVVRRAGAVVRLAPPEEGEGFRRAAAFPDGRVIALSQRGRLYDVRDGAATPLSARAQSGSRMVAVPQSDAVWIAGEAGRLRHFDLVSAAFTDVGEGGEAPTSALAATPSLAIVGRVDGVVRYGALGGTLADALVLPAEVTAVAASGPWVAAGTADGEVRTKRPKTNPSGASAKVSGRVVALALPAADDAHPAAHDPLLVVHEPAAATLLYSGAYEFRESVALAGRPLCGCPLPSGQGLYVGLENGDEVLVRVVRAR